MKAFELKKYLRFYGHTLERGQKTVMASLVGLNGSSYRLPGVRMLIAQDGAMSGALSGGCVEKEIVASAQSVFKSGVSKVISYDGQYRLGCEGLLHILIEPFELEEEHVEIIISQLKARQPIHVTSLYEKNTTGTGNYFSTVTLPSLDREIQINKVSSQEVQPTVFKQTVLPDLQLIIFGAEHDAEKLCIQAAILGWDVIIVTSPLSQKESKDFPKSKAVLAYTPETFDSLIVDSSTSVVLMTHNYALDLQFLLKLKNLDIPYIGILGSKKRKASLEFALLDHAPEIELSFLESLHSPAGLDLGAVTPQEIAVSIIAEIMQITKLRHQPVDQIPVKTIISSGKITLS